MNRWLWVLAFLFLLSSLGGTFLVVSKLEKMETALVAIATGKNPFSSKVDVSIPRFSMVTAHVTFSDNAGHSQTYTFSFPTSAEVDAEVDATKRRLAQQWGTEVVVTYLP